MMKTELNLLMACCMVLSACGALKSKKSLHTQELQSSSHNEENTNQQGWATRNTLLLDTSNSEYVVQITPLGKFFYNAENGGLVVALGLAYWLIRKWRFA
ncbi:hypothetical protein [Pedobacter sp. D749]|uniref:hypothetical protein n=1 Tax=Pedobacter sp. D749 TaxID=2856523 RepID=UPI001C59037E|nr:hypothetical protein [Pedobacter sp. D749]QXU41180.1 hypothetical protein KYH19_19590 [Pedobacter sp. D749]